MKKSINFLFAALLLLVVSCQKEEQTSAIATPDAPDGGPKVAISFANPTSTFEDDGTRAFGDGSTEAWEKSISSATIMIFDKADKLVLRRELTAANVNAAAKTPIALVVPGVAVGDNCNFALVVNRVIPATVVTRTLLEAELDADVAQYNGTYAEVTTKSKRVAGFVMTDIAAKAIIAGTTPVTLTLERVVSKVEIAAATTAAFNTKYAPATITINKITISAAASNSYLMSLAPTKYSAGTKTFSVSQSSSAGKNRFYLFEQAAAAAGSRVKLLLDATYDADGNTATTGDRVNLPYNLELAGTGATGQILRNGAYKINANINGLTGSDVTVTATVSNWATISISDAELGN